MQPTQSILKYIKGTEVLKLKAYMPTPDDVPTIGYGSTGPDIKLGMSWSVAQAEDRFGKYCAVLANKMNTALAPSPTTQNQFDAMFSLAYNIGTAGFLKSDVLHQHKAKNYTAAVEGFSHWTTQNHKILNGLVTRRAKEAAIYAA